MLKDPPHRTEQERSEQEVIIGSLLHCIAFRLNLLLLLSIYSNMNHTATCRKNVYDKYMVVQRRGGSMLQ